MSAGEVLAILAAGLAAGTINTVVGSGTLLTFPVLLAFGYSPLVANVSNSIGLAPGALSGAYGYRRELAGQRSRILAYSVASAAGALVGAALLLSLPSRVFDAVIPAIVTAAVILVWIGPRLAAWLARRRATREVGQHPLGARAAVFATGIYGGYFGAAQGVILLAVLGTCDPDRLQRTNALKNVLAGTANAVSGLVFVVAASVAWGPALLLAVSSIAGGQLGAGLGRRLSPAVLRGVIVVVGTFAALRLLFD